LGELSAKLAAAAGARVIVTYHRGERDAVRVAGEIAAGGGRATVIRYDVTEPARPQLAALSARPTHLWYFATPPIFRTRRDPFDPERFAEFVRHYVTGFAEVCGALAVDGPLAAFYPSSVAVVERPRGMTEYAAAKAAGELLCSDLTRLLPALRIVQRRLPRLPTDQTASVFRSALEDAPALFAPIVAEMHAPAAPHGASGECVRSRELA
jgi:NAD(P)-dependent dehydrogenase (short-subunit alcohol dehydrogenase family)